MGKKLGLFAGVFGLLIAGSAFSQDKIIRKNGDTVLANITEVLEHAVRYKMYNENNGPLYTLDKQRIAKVVFENGRVESYTPDLRDPELYAGQKKKAIKLNFLSPLMGFTQLTYEQNIKPGRGWEATLGIIGLGKNPDLNEGSMEQVDARGVFIGGGFKFIKMPNIVREGDKFWHVMHGAYIEPNAFVGLYSRNFEKTGNTNEVVRKNVQFGGLLLNLGKQWVLGDIMLVDVYGGIGYGFDNLKNQDTFESGFENYHYAILSNKGAGLGFTAGLKVGILLK